MPDHPSEREQLEAEVQCLRDRDLRKLHERWQEQDAIRDEERNREQREIELQEVAWQTWQEEWKSQ